MKNTILASASVMALHFSAFALNIAAAPYEYETKDSEPTLKDLNDTIEKINKGFDTFKKTNDERLAEIEKNGKADPLLDEKLAKITEEITSLKTVREQVEKLMKRAARPGGDVTEIDGEKFTPEQVEHKKKFEAFLRNPSGESAKSELEVARKAVGTTTDSAGGYAVPEIISRMIERELPDANVMRGLVDVQPAGSKDFKILVDVRGMAYGWVGEGDTRPETNTPTLQEVAPTFGTIYAYPKAAEESLDDIFFNVTNWLVNSGIEAFAEGEENAIINGNGTKKPTGFLNGTPDKKKDGTRAFGTLQFRASGAASGFASSNPADPLRQIVYDLKKSYRRNATWLMNKATVGRVMVMKDGDDNYLWQPAASMGQPDRLMGYMVAESEEMPDVAANKFPIAFGDFMAGYVLCPLVGLRLTRDDVTTPGFVKWYLRRRVGGKTKKSEAIKLVKIAV